VTAGVAYGEKNWFILRLCSQQCFITPSPPINWVFCVFAEVQTLGLSKAIRHDSQSGRYVTFFAQSNTFHFQDKYFIILLAKKLFSTALV
jgi:hypothetical protein